MTLKKPKTHRVRGFLKEANTEDDFYEQLRRGQAEGLQRLDGYPNTKVVVRRDWDRDAAAEGTGGHPRVALVTGGKP